MKFGIFTFFIVSDGTFWLDGGAMFGIVPKVLWNKLNPADELNRIKLGLNCLLIQTPERNVLVDTGIGKKLDDKFKEMYRVERNTGLIESLGKIGVQPEEINFVVNTHLHFDHCGGNTVEKNGNYIPTFPNAQYVIQKQEWHDAINTNERTKASYVQENFLPIEASGQLLLVDGDYEVLPGISVVVTNGHTRGHQSVMIESEDKKAIYFGDLVPTSSHVKIPYIMGYDLFPLNILETKKRILKQAMDEHWLLFFEHDPKMWCAYLREKEGKPVLEPLQNKNSEFQKTNSKQFPINQSSSSKPYNLEERTLQFSKDVINFVKTLPKTPGNIEYSKQLIKSSGSVGANYIEANEALSKKDFVMRIKICRKEAKESAYWLRLVETNNKVSERNRQLLIDEATQLLKIFNSMVEKSK